MADAATDQLVRQIVQEKVQAGAMFTAFDVTQEARRRGSQARHGDVKDVVHDCFQQGQMGATYQRTLVNIGAPTQPFLYHRFDADPKNYRPPGGPAAPPPSQPAAPGPIRRVLNKLFGTGGPPAGGVPPAGVNPPGVNPPGANTHRR